MGVSLGGHARAPRVGRRFEARSVPGPTQAAAALVVSAVLLSATAAHADVDWAQGLVTGQGIGLADRLAPNPAVARGPALRKAEAAARQVLEVELGRLPLAGGGIVADRLADANVKDRMQHALGAALTIAADPETDGSWRVTMAVPIEAVRQAIDGLRELPAPPGDRGPAVVIVEGVTSKPAVGHRIGSMAAATVWVTALPPWAKGAPRIKAKGQRGAAIDADPGKATASTLFVIVTK
jgi:hypothetical protein